MGQWCLECAESAFSLPELATEDDDWREWVDEYVAESKRLLTVRRNATAFSLLEQWGCESVVRKGGLEIELADYDLDLPKSEALAWYAEAHIALWTEFVEESVRRSGIEQLLRADGPSKAAFVDYLEKAA